MKSATLLLICAVVAAVAFITVDAKLDVSHADSLQPHASDAQTNEAVTPADMPKSVHKLFKRMAIHLDTEASAKVEADIATDADAGTDMESTTGTDSRSKTGGAAITQAASGAGGKCGVDITDALKKVVTDLNAYWPTLPKAMRDETCSYLGPLSNLISGRNPKMAGVAWDIAQMYSKNYPNLFAPQNPAGCADASGACKLTVGVDGQCSYTGSVNYVIFGHMCRLCDKFKVTMDALIYAYKGNALFGLADNYEASKAWANAGFDKWGLSGISVKSPKNDRPQCAVSCGPWKGKPFTVHWHPYELMVSDRKYVKW